MNVTVVIVISGSAAMVLDALGRLELAARRWGGEVCVQDPDPAFVELLDVCGLADVLPRECPREAEQKEQARFEEGLDRTDLGV